MNTRPSIATENPFSRLTLVGASYRTTPLHLLGSVAFAKGELEAVHRELKETLPLEEVLVLSTCNRTEIYAIATELASGTEAIEKWLLRRSAARSALSSKHLYYRAGAEAVQHFLKIICGLDSMILGETEIAGQIQDATDFALLAKSSGPALQLLLSSAFHTAKRARSETGIAQGTTSVASAAVHLAERVTGQLEQRTVLILGAGETSALLARHLRTQSPHQIIVSNRTIEKAQILADEVGATVVPFDEWPQILSTVDIAICATHSPVFLITKAMAAAAAHVRTSPLLLLDISLPQNIDPAAGEIENVFLHDMTDLTHIVEKTLAKRAKEVPAVDHIIADEQRRFSERLAAKNAGPIIRDLRQHFEQVRQAELERLLPKFSETDRPLAERLTRDLINKLLHHPTVELRTLGDATDADLERLTWARRLFGIDGGQDK